MATGYGGWAGGDDYRSIITANVTTDGATSVKISYTAQVQSQYGSFSGMTMVQSVYRNGAYVNGGSLGSMANGTTYTLCSGTVTVSKTSKAQTVTFSVGLSGNGAYCGNSTASCSVTVSAIQSYTVSYNANGGSGAPSSQTKYKGTNLKLTTSKPTRNGYTFQKWNTKSDGTGTNYSPGGTYSTDANATLYAQWKLNYAAPAISSMSVYRCSDASGTQADEGTYAYLKLGWKVNQSGQTASAITLRYRRTTATTWTTAYTKSLTFSGTSGTAETAIYSNSGATTLLTFDTSYAYVIEATFKDSGSHSAKTSRTLSAAYFTFDLKPGGQGVGGVGIGHSADVAGAVRIGMDVQLDSYRSGSYEHGNFSCVDNRLPDSSSAANDTNSTWGNGLFFYGGGFNPNSGNPIYQAHGYVRGVNLSSGARGVQVEAQRYVSGERKTNALNVTVDSSGNGHATLGGVGIFMTHGSIGQTNTVNANSYKDISITFGHTYSSAPHVIPAFYSTSTAAGLGGLSIAVAAVTTTGATIRIFNNTSTARSPGFHWLAIGD